MTRPAALLAALGLAASAVVTTVGALSSPVGAAQGVCTTDPVTKVVTCPKGWELGEPGRPSNPGNPNDPQGPGGFDTGIECHYVNAGEGWEEFIGPPPSPEAIPVFMVCSIDGVPLQTVGAETLPTWVEPGQVPPPDPAVVALLVRNSVVAKLVPPAPVADPAIGTPAVLESPTFVAVDNWQGTQRDTGCLTAGGVTVCVEIVAEPTLTFDPGDGSDPVPCEPGGTRYDRSGPRPRAQAERDGACAHVYERRTGVADRPDEWAGELTIDWDVSWAQVGGGPDGVFEPVVLTGDVPRAVEEVQSVETND